MNITTRKPFTPGEILKEEFMEPLGLSQQELAEKIAVPRRRINEIIKGKRAISPDTAWRLARIFQMTPEYWLNLQMKMDLWQTIHNQKKKKTILRIKPITQIAFAKAT